MRKQIRSLGARRLVKAVAASNLSNMPTKEILSCRNNEIDLQPANKSNKTGFVS